MNDTSCKLCFSCGKIYYSGNSPVLTCPNCGKQLPLGTYEAVMQDARDAVEFGWNYRLQYEADLQKNGRITTHYDLEPYGEIFSFIALAAASGVIGGAAYDVVKKILGNIRDFVSQLCDPKEKSKIFALIDNKENMKKFLQYIDEFYTCFDSVDAEVQNAILEEMLVDQISPTLERLILTKNPDIPMDEIKAFSPFSEEEIFNGMLEVRRNIERRKRLTKASFQDFWGNIDQ